jgi:hypothetical protein
METREDRERIYREGAEFLQKMVGIRRAHVHAVPECSAAPLCVSALGLINVAGYTSGDPYLTRDLILVAIGEMSRLGDELEGVRRSLDIQRGLTNDAIRAHDSAMRRADDAEEEQQRLLAMLDDTEHRLSGALAELTVWEESADHLSPAALPVIEP